MELGKKKKLQEFPYTAALLYHSFSINIWH